MLTVTLLAAVVVLLTQGCEASDNEAQIEVESWNKVLSLAIRDIRGKSVDSDRADEERKQKLRDKGFLWTVWDDVFKVFIGPFVWAWDIITFPFTLSLISKYRWDIWQESKSEAASATPAATDTPAA